MTAKSRRRKLDRRRKTDEYSHPRIDQETRGSAKAVIGRGTGIDDQEARDISKQFGIEESPIPGTHFEDNYLITGEDYEEALGRRAAIKEFFFDNDALDWRHLDHVEIWTPKAQHAEDRILEELFRRYEKELRAVGAPDESSASGS